MAVAAEGAAVGSHLSGCGIWKAASSRLAALSAAGAPTSGCLLSGAGQVLLRKGGQAEEQHGQSEGTEAPVENLFLVKMRLEKP